MTSEYLEEWRTAQLSGGEILAVALADTIGAEQNKNGQWLYLHPMATIDLVSGSALSCAETHVIVDSRYLQEKAKASSMHIPDGAFLEPQSSSAALTEYLEANHLTRTHT